MTGKAYAEMTYDEQRAFLGLPDVGMKRVSAWAQQVRRTMEQFTRELRDKMRGEA